MLFEERIARGGLKTACRVLDLFYEIVLGPRLNFAILNGVGVSSEDFCRPEASS